ncbi:MAG: LysR family transcriptional regulator [Rhodospirillaceae bacterium]|nr:LysR family transcriptional regulator [Rhodospirillaceae bacterium]MYF07494.1 LysR family transcriptional regulator [Rhodospirillaceae bacterium]MYH38200.1 LysR family transcriptional regulator [Rhodospirillaceae bacterium]MYJ70842.1 LysR family transcriptional regulator [Rhodospirillaceae bacterium]MYK14430.1 LysR family transcriptional regulator [Rhodospirillaceae bacterium]
MKLTHFRYFAAVAEEMSFSRAGDRLRISQSALSRQVLLMEEELGVRLFDRIGRHIELTAAGRDLLDRSKAILNDVDALSLRAKALAKGSRGVLRIGATPQTMESVVARFLATFRRRSPDIEIKLVEDGSARLSQRLESGDLELAIAGLPSNSALAGRPLLPLGLLAVVPAGSRFAGHSRVDIGELASETILLLKPQFMTRRIFDGVCQVANINPQILIESDSPHCLLALVESDQGIAVVPSTVLLGPLEDRAIPICHGDRLLGFNMSVLWDPRRFVSPAMKVFIEDLYAATRINFPGSSFNFPDMDVTVSRPQSRSGGRLRSRGGSQ